MIVPKIGNPGSKYPFTLNKTLAPLNDELDQLSVKRWRVSTASFGASYTASVNVLSFFASDEITETFRRN
ncbi:hypothetical protein WICPIJ_003035 [Wickerhamomyces pijperi]|uniref:Uncharacterized protein n=1 Tax=Wickerhamomyces pijperi TaxID=599730 RepID=A0A9P8QAN9_WICPI|nr:hypothetical protein WICPIJ_003035 [Wickerhamomyces pijperi]